MLKEALMREGPAHPSWVADTKRPSKEVTLHDLYIHRHHLVNSVPRSHSLST